jgi:hypothetical protein
VFDERKMRQACLADRALPLSTPVAILRAALTETDPAKGACPDVPPPG